MRRFRFFFLLFVLYIIILSYLITEKVVLRAQNTLFDLSNLKSLTLN
jgi:hypothetical protein